VLPPAAGEMQNAGPPRQLLTGGSLLAAGQPVLNAAHRGNLSDRIQSAEKLPSLGNLRAAQQPRHVDNSTTSGTKYRICQEST